MSRKVQLETYTETKELIENPCYKNQRQNNLDPSLPFHIY